MGATDLKHPFTVQVDLGRGAMVELDMEPVGLVGFRERQRASSASIRHRCPLREIRFVNRTSG